MKPYSHNRGGLFPKPLAISASVSGIMKARGFNDAAILQYWNQAIADDEIARHCYPIKLTNQMGYSTLLVKVHPAYAAIFAHQSGTILQRLNHLCGRNVAKKISIIQ